MEFTFSNHEEQTKHGNASFPCSLYEYSAPISISEKIYCHYHAEVEFLYITEGNATLTINHRIYAISQGDFIMIPSSHLHMVIGDNLHPFRFIACVFHPDFISSFGNDTIQQKYINSLVNWNYTHSPVIHHDSYLESTMNSVLDTWKLKNDGYELHIKIDILSIISHLYTLVSKESKVTISSSDYKINLLKSVIQHIQNYYFTSITLANTAQHFSISKSHLSRFFKEMTNMNFTDYLNYYRINKSAELLLTTDLSISEIAERTGFHNFSFFDRTFFRYMNETPRNYRKQHVLRTEHEKRIIF